VIGGFDAVQQSVVGGARGPSPKEVELTAVKKSSANAKKAAPAKKASAANKAAAGKKATAATKAAPTKKSARPATKATPAKAAAAKSPIKKATVTTSIPAKKSAPSTKAAPAKKATTAKKSATTAPPVKAAATKESATKSAPAKKAAPAPVKAVKKAAPEPPKRPTVGPYAKDTKFLDAQRVLLNEERTIYAGQAVDLRAEADSLALEREPGDVQFDEESGEGGTVTVDRERNLALSAQATAAVEEIDDALRKIDRKSYGGCERCFQPIPKARLQALPFARLCVACKSGGLSRR
jgi:DnaK suppressor protein